MISATWPYNYKNNVQKTWPYCELFLCCMAMCEILFLCCMAMCDLVLFLCCMAMCDFVLFLCCMAMCDFVLFLCCMAKCAILNCFCVVWPYFTKLQYMKILVLRPYFNQNTIQNLYLQHKNNFVNYPFRP